MRRIVQLVSNILLSHKNESNNEYTFLVKSIYIFFKVVFLGVVNESLRHWNF